MARTDLTADDVAWDLEPLLPEAGPPGVDALLEQADAAAAALAEHRGRVGEFDGARLGSFLEGLAEVGELLGRAGSYAGLRFATDTADPTRGALLQRVEERSTAIATQLLFFELEWAALDDDRAQELSEHPRVRFAAHHLRALRRYRRHLLSEPEEIVH